MAIFSTASCLYGDKILLLGPMVSLDCIKSGLADSESLSSPFSEFSEIGKKGCDLVVLFKA